MSNANKTTIQPQMFPTYPNPMSNPSNSATQPNVENGLWVVGNISFQVKLRKKWKYYPFNLGWN